METNATTLASYHYWDSADGNAMVCSPLGPSVYRSMCNFNQYFLGIFFTIEGLWLLYNAMRLGRLESAVVPLTNASKYKEQYSMRQQARNRAHMIYYKTFTYALGFEFVGLGAMLFIGGMGTVYASSTLAGILGDFFFSAGMACNLYRSLLQQRGAKAFRNMVRLPNQDGAVLKRLSFTYVMDIVQSVGAFPIMFGLWVLLACGVFERSVFFSTISILIGSAGIRSMFENILDRVRTIVRLNDLQQNAPGDMVAKRRRRNTLKKKARALILHMLGISTTMVFLPLSVLIFGSVQSSTQLLIHYGTSHTVVGLVVLAVCATTQKHVDRNCSKQRKLLSKMETHQLSGMDNASRLNKSKMDKYRTKSTVANESGMSVVGLSEVVTRGRRSRGGGLFSDVQSDV